jgi:hypothetical protein
MSNVVGAVCEAQPNARHGNPADQDSDTRCIQLGTLIEVQTARGASPTFTY